MWESQMAHAHLHGCAQGSCGFLELWFPETGLQLKATHGNCIGAHAKFKNKKWMPLKQPWHESNNPEHCLWTKLVNSRVGMPAGLMLPWQAAGQKCHHSIHFFWRTQRFWCEVWDSVSWSLSQQFGGSSCSFTQTVQKHPGPPKNCSCCPPCCLLTRGEFGQQASNPCWPSHQMIVSVGCYDQCSNCFWWVSKDTVLKCAFQSKGTLRPLTDGKKTSHVRP